MKGRGDASGENDQSFERSRTVRLTTANNISRVCVRAYVCAGRKHRTYYHVPDRFRQIRDVLFRFSDHGLGRGAVENLVSLMADARAALKMFLICVRARRIPRTGNASNSHRCGTLANAGYVMSERKLSKVLASVALPSFFALWRYFCRRTTHGDFPN